MKTLATILFATTVALAGCGKEKSQTPATEPAAESAAAPATESAAESAAENAAGAAADSAAEQAAAADEIDVPTEMDFEDVASEAITDKNLEDHVKAYEEELAQM